MKEKIFNILKYIIIVLVIAVCLFVLAPILILIGAHKLGVQWFIIWSILFIGILKIILLSLKKNKYFKTLKYLAYGFFGFIFLVSSIFIYKEKQDWYEMHVSPRYYILSKNGYVEAREASDEELKKILEDDIDWYFDKRFLRKEFIGYMEFDLGKYDEYKNNTNSTDKDLQKMEELRNEIDYEKRVINILDEL